MFLVIDSDNYAEHGVVASVFPGGEPHVRLPRAFTEPLLLHLKLRSWLDVGHAALLMDALDNQGAVYCAFVPYLPGARQDQTDGMTGVTKHVVLSLLRPDLRRVYVFDVHSKLEWMAVTALTTNLPPTLLDLGSLLTEEYAGVVVMKGSDVERGQAFANTLPNTPSLIAFAKPAVGAAYVVPEGPAFRLGERYLVVTDIYDDEAMLNALATAIPDRVELHLWASHAIMRNGMKRLSVRYSRVFTTDGWARTSWLGWDCGTNDRLSIIPLAPLFPLIMHDPYIRSYVEGRRARLEQQEAQGGVQ